MSKFSRKVRRWLSAYGRNVLIALVVVGIVALGVWYGAATNEKVVQEDFGDASVSDVARGEALGSYQEALDMMEAGKVEEGRQVMQRLAPIMNEGQTARGSGEAHLWMAKDLLRGQMEPFLGRFPIEYAGGKALTVAAMNAVLIERAGQHLRSALTLQPDLDEAVVKLAEVMIVTGKRNEAMKLLEQKIADVAVSRSGLGIYLANAMAYAGDDVALKEAAWITLNTLGKEVTDEKVADLPARMRYLLTIFMLQRKELAEVAIQKFSRDFADHKGAAEMIAGVKASWAYFQAMAALGEKSPQPEVIAAALIEAHAAQPGRRELVEALAALVKKFPELKSSIEAALKEQPVTGAGVDTARWSLLLADVSAEGREGYLQRALDAAPTDPMAVLANLDRDLKPEEAKQLVASISHILKAGGISGREEYVLRVARGESQLKAQQWQGALKDLERGLMLKQVASPEELAHLHKQLAMAYQELGRDEIAEQHLALAR